MPLPELVSLFDPIELRGTRIRNRAWVSPMCMYSCEGEDGRVGDFHLVHYGSFAIGGAGLIVTEATAVAPEGRLTPQDAGLWEDAQIEPWARIVRQVHASGAAICIQLAHAGRKASKYRELPEPAGGRGPIPDEDGGWQPRSVGDTPFGTLRMPQALSNDEVRSVIAGFADAARRAVATGADGVEIHAGHGYLIHEFLSPITNRRSDEWGSGARERTRLLREVVTSVRAALGPEPLLLVRLSASDVVEGGTTVDETAALAQELVELGADLIDCSSGGLVAGVEYDPAPGYQVPGTRAVRATGVPAGAVGLITEARHADELIAAGDADVVFLARAMLRDPHWARHAAAELGASHALEVPVPYIRAWHRSAFAAVAGAAS